jgi:hypothetical protein
MKPMLGHQIGPQLVEALGLPKNTSGFTLRCYAGEAVSVVCEYWPEDAGLAKALAQYNLVATGGTIPTAKGFDFNAWMRDRTERAHREFMERISRHLPCDWTTEDLARYMGAPLD